jgi:hypothetical protein
MPIQLGVNHTGIAKESLKELTTVMEWINNWSPEFVDSIGWKEREKRVRELIEKAKQEVK